MSEMDLKELTRCLGWTQWWVFLGLAAAVGVMLWFDARFLALESRAPCACEAGR